MSKKYAHLRMRARARARAGRDCRSTAFRANARAYVVYAMRTLPRWRGGRNSHRRLLIAVMGETT